MEFRSRWFYSAWMRRIKRQVSLRLSSQIYFIRRNSTDVLDKKKIYHAFHRIVSFRSTVCRSPTSSRCKYFRLYFLRRSLGESFFVVWNSSRTNERSRDQFNSIRRSRRKTQLLKKRRKTILTVTSCSISLVSSRLVKQDEKLIKLQTSVFVIISIETVDVAGNLPRPRSVMFSWLSVVRSLGLVFCSVWKKTKLIFLFQWIPIERVPPLVVISQCARCVWCWFDSLCVHMTFLFFHRRAFRFFCLFLQVNSHEMTWSLSQCVCPSCARTARFYREKNPNDAVW